MIMTELIAKKREGQELSKEEINFMVEGFTEGRIPDYQMSAMCMAILLKGMEKREIYDLTVSMTESGDILNLSGIEGIKADKHSTGGVGDKTSLVLCPMLAACGVKVAKMSGRGLGHTGGTIDKLESFPGFQTAISDEKFVENVNKIGIAIAGQTANLAPADKKLYALRDVTGTVPSIPLIVSSIMSKKLAAGSDVIVLDVKTGDGAFMKTLEDSVKLAENLIEVGKGAGKMCAAVISDMNQPLGYTIGNALEVKEAIAVLKGNLQGDLLDLCLTIGSTILYLAGIAESNTAAAVMLMNSINDGSALNKLKELVAAQGGDPAAVDNVELLPTAEVKINVPADTSGYVKSIAAEKLGLVSMHLGGGRQTKEDTIDLGVGIVLNKKVGDKIQKGDRLATVYASDYKSGYDAAEEVLASYDIVDSPVEPSKLIKDILF